VQAVVASKATRTACALQRAATCRKNSIDTVSPSSLAGAGRGN
jgi:hypothetical protein